MGQTASVPTWNSNGLAIVPLKKEFMVAVPYVNQPGVVLYSEPGMHGTSRYFPPGSYQDLAKYDFARRARSLSIGPGTRISIYAGKNFDDMNTHYQNADNSSFGIADLTIFNNAISSMRVTRIK